MRSVSPVSPALTVTTICDQVLCSQYLEDNEALIQTIHDTISHGRFDAAVQYQQQLQRNLMWLAAIADAPAGATLPAQVNLERC